MRKNKKAFIIVFLCVLAVGMGIGYSILSKQLKIEGSVTVKPSFDVAITGIKELPNHGFSADNILGTGPTRAHEIAEPTFTETTANFNVRLELGGSIAYVVSIRNNGMGATFDPVLIEKTGNSDVNVQTILDLENRFIDGAQTINYLVLLSYDRSDDMDNSTTESNITITFNAKQAPSSGGLRHIAPSIIFVDEPYCNGGLRNYYYFKLVNEPFGMGDTVYYESVDGSEYVEISSVEDGESSNVHIAGDNIHYYPATNLSSGTHIIKIKGVYYGEWSNELTITHRVL